MKIKSIISLIKKAPNFSQKSSLSLTNKHKFSTFLKKLSLNENFNTGIGKQNIINNNKMHFTSTNINQEKEELRIPEHTSYDVPNFIKNKNFDFPWLINGAPSLDINSRFLPDQLFARNRNCTRRELLEHFFKMYRGVLLASTQFDYEFISEYCEERLAEKLNSKLKRFKDNNFRLEIVEDLKAVNNSERMSPEFHFYDNIIIKGVNLDRKKNYKKSEYSVCDDIDEVGFISYIHGNLSDTGRFLTREQGEEAINQSDFKTIIFRAYCIFRTGMKLFSYDSLGNSIYTYDKNYSFNHACIFECELQGLAPLKSFSKTETFTEWIAKHDFSVWKICDMDNWMKGNDYFLE